MKMVEITRDHRPFHAGQNAVVSDQVATALEAEGVAVNPRSWPPRAAPSLDDIGAGPKPPKTKRARHG